MEVSTLDGTCSMCGGEHHAVMPRRTVVYYGGAQFYVSTRLVPTVKVTAWQGIPHATASRMWDYYRNDMFNGQDLRFLARSDRRG